MTSQLLLLLLIRPVQIFLTLTRCTVECETSDELWVSFVTHRRRCLFKFRIFNTIEIMDSNSRWISVAARQSKRAFEDQVQTEKSCCPARLVAQRHF